MSVSERNPCIATKKEMEPREPVVTYNGEDRSEAELRAGVGACFWCLRHFETIPYSELRFMPPLRGSHLFFWGRFPGFRPLRGSTAGLYFIAPLRGSNLGSRLRCCAATPRQALALAKLPHHHPFNFRFIGLFVFIRRAL